MIRPAVALFGAMVVMILCFTAGRSCERREWAGRPPQTDTIRVKQWVDRYLDVPSGPKPAVVAEAVTDTVLDIRIAGCQSTTPAPGLPTVRPIETILSVRAEAGTVQVARVNEDRRGVMTEVRLPERGNKIYVGAQGGTPVVVGDRWWWLRDVEVVGFASAAGAYLGGKVPVTTSISVMGGRGTEGDVFVGAAWRPFVNWP